MGQFQLNHVIVCYNNNFKYFQRFNPVSPLFKIEKLYMKYIWKEKKEEERGKK